MASGDCTVCEPRRASKEPDGKQAHDDVQANEADKQLGTPGHQNLRTWDLRRVERNGAKVECEDDGQQSSGAPELAPAQQAITGLDDQRQGRYVIEPSAKHGVGDARRNGHVLGVHQQVQHRVRKAPRPQARFPTRVCPEAWRKATRPQWPKSLCWPRNASKACRRGARHAGTPPPAQVRCLRLRAMSPCTEPSAPGSISTGQRQHKQGFFF